MAGENTVSVLSAGLKQVYAGQLEKLYPNKYWLTKNLKFIEKDGGTLGRQFNQPVQLSREYGITLNSDGSAYALNSAVAGTLAEAQVDGISCTVRGRVSYAAAAKCLKATGDARNKAFFNAANHVIEGMVDGSGYVQELELLYGMGATAGDLGMGQVSSKTSGGGTLVQVYQMTAATWAAGIWAGTEGLFVDAYSTGDVKRNGGTLQVTAVNLDTRSITLTGVSPTTTGEMDAIVVTDRFVLRGSHNTEMAGLYVMSHNTGTLFNISAATYSLWKPSQYSAQSGQLTFAKMMKAMNAPVERGLNQDFTWLTGIGAWTDMMNDLVVLRRYADNAGGKLTQGANSLEFEGLNGRLIIRPHSMIMGGHSLGFAQNKVQKIGATDLTTLLAPNAGGRDNFFTELADNAGFEMRNFWLLAPFCSQPATCLAAIDSIVNSA